MHPTHCHTSVKSANKFIADLAPLTPFKLSRFREVHALALGFSSYNALVAKLKNVPVYFNLNTYFEHLSICSLEKHGVQFNIGNDSSTVGNLLDTHKAKSSVSQKLKYARLDFQVLSFPYAGKKPESTAWGITNIEDLYWEFDYSTINEFLSKVITREAKDNLEGSSVYQNVISGGLAMGELTVLAGRPKTSKSDTLPPLPNVDYFTSPITLETSLSNYDPQTKEFSGFRLSKTAFESEGSLLFFTSSRGDLAPMWDGFKVKKPSSPDGAGVGVSRKPKSHALITGYGSLFIKLDDSTHTSINFSQNDTETLVELSNSSNRGEAPIVSFVGVPQIEYKELLPSPEHGHICHLHDLDESVTCGSNGLYEYSDLIKANSTDDAYQLYMGNTRYDSTYCIPVDRYGRVLESLNEEWKDGLNVVVDNYIEHISFHRPTGIDATTELGRDVAQGIHSVHNSMKEVYRSLEKFENYTMQDTTSKDSLSTMTCHLGEDVYIEVLNVDPDAVDVSKLKKLDNVTYTPSLIMSSLLPYNIQIIGTGEKFAQLLINMGASSIQYVEMTDDHACDMYGNIFTAFTQDDSCLVQFTINSSDGFSEMYSEVVNCIHRALPVGSIKQVTD